MLGIALALKEISVKVGEEAHLSTGFTLDTLYTRATGGDRTITSGIESLMLITQAHGRKNNIS
jgi:hypothetical protein